MKLWNQFRLPSPMWMGILQSTEGQNRTEKAEKGKIICLPTWLSWNISLLPLDSQQSWFQVFRLGPEPACKWQIAEFLGLHNHMSQFLIITLSHRERSSLRPCTFAHTIPPSFGIFFHLLPLWLKSNHAPKSTFLMKTFLITSCPSAVPQVRLLYVCALSLFLCVFCVSLSVCLFIYPIDFVFLESPI